MMLIKDNIKKIIVSGDNKDDIVNNIKFDNNEIH